MTFVRQLQHITKHWGWGPMDPCCLYCRVFCCFNKFWNTKWVQVISDWATSSYIVGTFWIHENAGHVEANLLITIVVQKLADVWLYSWFNGKKTVLCLKDVLFYFPSNEPIRRSIVSLLYLFARNVEIGSNVTLLICQECGDR